MDQAALVKDQIKGGEKLLQKLSDAKFDMVGACWTRTDTDDQWYLYIVSPSIPEKGVRPGFVQIGNVLDAMEGDWADEFERIDSLDVKLIPPSNRLAEGILRILRRHPDDRPTRQIGNGSLGFVPVEGAYIYPATLFDKQPTASAPHAP